MGEKKFDTIVIRIDSKTKKQVEQEAGIQGITVSSLIRNIINDYLQKDIIWQGQVQASLEMLRSKIDRLNRDVNLFSDFWLLWTEYYFAYTKPFGDMDEQQKKVLIHQGKNRTDMMVEAFKIRVKEKKPGFVEKFVSDYIVQDKDEV